MFEKTLTDLIRGIRANKKDEQKYVAQALQEIRKEVKEVDPDTKATAIQKLTYLEMMGYDMSWASFHVIEVMSSPKYANKRIGYLAAAQSFRQDTDVLMLTTNLIKKDLASHNHLEIGIAINGLSQLVTPDLARDLYPDLMSMLNHSRPYVRKKAILVLYKTFLKYPEALRICFPRLREKLDDPDPSVVSAAVNVICELARKNPKNYLALAPQLFGLLTTSSNNWMLIKIIKLFAALTPLEPRLVKKLLPPLTSLIETTPAMSLLYECIYTVISGGMLNTPGRDTEALAKTCVAKLMTFLEDPDQNLKYIGLLALAKILPTYPNLIAEHQETILECLDDADQSIRYRALDLVGGMVNRKNLQDIVKRLMSHLLPEEAEEDSSAPGVFSANATDPSYRSDVIDRILLICSQNSYANVTNFEWYISVLVQLVYVAGINVGDAIKAQFIDVAARVEAVRSYCVQKMIKLLADNNLLQNADQSDSNSNVLYAAAWIVGEYCQHLDSSIDVIEYLLNPNAVKLPAEVQAVYVQNIAKIFAHFANDLVPSWDNTIRTQLLGVVDIIIEKLTMFASCMDLEVQERAVNVREMFVGLRPLLNTPSEFSDLVSFDDTPKKSPTLQYITDASLLFQSAGELNPVAARAQRKVPIPAGLDLDMRIHDLPAEFVAMAAVEPEEESAEEDFFEEKGKHRRKKKSEPVIDEATKERRRQERLKRRKDDPYYIMDEKASKTQTPEDEDDIDSIPIVKLDLNDFPNASILNANRKKTKKKTKAKAPRAPTPPPVVITTEGEMPENAANSEDEQPSTNGKSASLSKRKNVLKVDDSLIDLDLDAPSAATSATPEAAAAVANGDKTTKPKKVKKTKTKEGSSKSKKKATA